MKDSRGNAINQFLWSLVRNSHWKAYKVNANLMVVYDWNNGYLNLSVDCMNSIVDVNKALLLSSLILSLPKSKSLVIDKSLWCKLLESTRLISSKNVFLAQRSLRQRRNSLLFDILTNSYKLRNLENYVYQSLILVSSFKPSKFLSIRNFLWVEEILFGFSNILLSQSSQK